jgi:hypothetical protein
MILSWTSRRVLMVGAMVAFASAGAPMLASSDGGWPPRRKPNPSPRRSIGASE